MDQQRRSLAAQQVAATAFADAARPDLDQLPTLMHEVAATVNDLRVMQTRLIPLKQPSHRRHFVKALTRHQQRFRRLLWTNPDARRLYLKLSKTWLRLMWPTIVELCLIVVVISLVTVGLFWLGNNWSQVQGVIDDLFGQIDTR